MTAEQATGKSLSWVSQCIPCGWNEELAFPALPAVPK